MSSPNRMLPVLLCGTFMGFLDLFLVIVAVPSIAADLHAGVAATQLVLSMYVVSYGAVLVIGGRLGDRYGRRRLFGLGMAGFTVSSLGCALAPSIVVLIVVRAVQGGCAAAMLPQVLATIQATLEGQERQRAMLLYTTALGCAGAFGQLIGGGLLALDVLGLGWRMLFLINLPIGIIALALVSRTVPETRAPRAEAIDLPGALVLSASLALVLLGLGTGPNDGWSALSCGLIGAGVLIGATLPAIERRAPTPLLPPALLAQRSVRWGLTATLAFYAANNLVFVGLTLFVQNGLGHGPLVAGLAYLPLGAIYVAVTLAGRAERAPRGAQAMLIGAILMLAALAATSLTVLLGAGLLVVALVLGLFGIGLGLVYPAVIATVLARVRCGDEGAATGVLLTTTQVSNALGIAITAAVWTALHGIGPDDRLVAELAVGAALVGAVGVAASVLRAQRSPAMTAAISA